MNYLLNLFLHLKSHTKLMYHKNISVIKMSNICQNFVKRFFTFIIRFEMMDFFCAVRSFSWQLKRTNITLITGYPLGQVLFRNHKTLNLFNLPFPQLCVGMNSGSYERKSFGMHSYVKRRNEIKRKIMLGITWQGLCRARPVYLLNVRLPVKEVNSCYDSIANVTPPQKLWWAGTQK
jgi:hypothetical protein